MMRHAKSDWNAPDLSDHDRPLNHRGRRSAPLMAQHLCDQGLQTNIILASSARRVQETLELMLPMFGSDVTVKTDDNLYLAPPQEIVRLIEILSDEHQCAMVVGHNPGICALVSHIAGEGIEMPTAAVAVFETPADTWENAGSDSDWKLTGYWKPRELEA